MPVNKQFYDHKIPLKLLYVLPPSNEADIEFHEATEVQQKIIILKNRLHIPIYLKGLKKENPQLKRLANITPKIRIVRLYIPKSGFDIKELMNLIQEDLATRGFSTGSIRTLQSKKSLETEDESLF